MRVLVCAENIFSGVGGGQSFYADLLRRYPEHQFWYFANDPDAELNVPFNVHVVSALRYYRDTENDLSSDGFAVRGHSLGGKKHDLLYMLDLAASLPDVHFDVVDIPDYMAMAQRCRRR